MKVLVDPESLAALVRAARGLIRHDKAHDAREGLGNCHELEVLEDTISGFCILYGDPDETPPRGVKVMRCT